MTSPAFIVMKAADAFANPTTAINQLWQTDFTYLKVTGRPLGWMRRISIGGHVCSPTMDPPSRSVLILLPLTLINVLDYAANALKMHRTDVIRRSLIRDVNSLLREEVLRAQRNNQDRQDWSDH